MDQHVSTVEQGLDHFSERTSTAKETSTSRRRLARLVGVALGALAVAGGSYAAPISNDAKLHLAAAPEDFKALGIGKEIEVREDGRRTPQSSDYFEWWYFDGLFDDGTVFVVWFGDNWLYGSHRPGTSFGPSMIRERSRATMQIFRSALIALRAISKPTPFTWTPPKPAMWAAI